jgi:hypothetical protein
MGVVVVVVVVVGVVLSELPVAVLPLGKRAEQGPLQAQRQAFDLRLAQAAGCCSVVVLPLRVPRSPCHWVAVGALLLLLLSPRLTLQGLRLSVVLSCPPMPRPMPSPKVRLVQFRRAGVGAGAWEAAKANPRPRLCTQVVGCPGVLPPTWAQHRTRE